MKAQRRHELKENDLSHAMTVARNYLDENGKSLFTTLLIVAVVAAGLGVMVQSRNTARDDRWRRRSELTFTDPQVGRESLTTLATLTQDADDDFVLSSLIEQGQQALRLTVQVDVPPDRQLNDTARTAFERLLREYPDNKLAFGIAHLGLATVAENEFSLDGNIAHRDDALSHLSAVVDSPEMDPFPFKGLAVDRRKALDATFTQITLAKPKPVAVEPAIADPANPSPVAQPQPDAAGQPVFPGTDTTTDKNDSDGK